MIESEEKRKRLTDTVTRWTQHTKVDHLLRDGDVPGLVQSILQEFYHIHLSCGHMVAELDEITTLSWKDVEGECYGSVCKECAERYKRELGAWEVVPYSLTIDT